MSQIISIAERELRLILKGGGVALVMLLAPIIYATIYSAGYAEQVAHKVPIAIIDHSNSHSSRQVVMLLNAAPELEIRYSVADIQCAKQLLLHRKIYGIVEIPSLYERRLLRGEQAVISVYCDASYFLMYRQVFQGVARVISTINNSKTEPQAVLCSSHTLFNPALGYGTFIMPAVLLVILQQTGLIAIGMLGGIWRQRGLYGKYSPLAVVVAKMVVYSAIYALIAGYILALHYQIFGYPMRGSLLSVVAVVVPYILSFSLLGIALSTLFRRPESAILSLLWTSIPVLLLSGASLPAEAFPRWLYIVGKVVPSSSAAGAYIRIETMGATIAEVRSEIMWLWAEVVIYGALAVAAIKKRMPGRTTKSRTSYP